MIAISRCTAGLPNEQQPPLLTPRPSAGRQQPRETARVQEREPAQVEHQTRRSTPLDAPQLLIERIGMLEIQLAAECHAHRAAREWLDGQPEASHLPSIVRVLTTGTRFCGN